MLLFLVLAGNSALFRFLCSYTLLLWSPTLMHSCLVHIDSQYTHACVRSGMYWQKQSLLHKQWVTLHNMQTDGLYHSELMKCKLDCRTFEIKLGTIEIKLGTIEIKLESHKFLKAYEQLLTHTNKMLCS